MFCLDLLNDQSEIGYFNQGAYASVIVERLDDYNKAKKIADELKQKHKIDAYVHRKRIAATKN